MGYNLYITRAEFWAENAGSEIGEDEWTDLIAADPELDPNPELGPHAALWSGPSQLPGPWLMWDAGNVYTKNPDEPLIEKMVRLAEQLGAVVQGDDGEVYPIATGEAERGTAPPRLDGTGTDGAGSDGPEVVTRPEAPGLFSRLMSRLASASEVMAGNGTVLRKGGRVREIFGDKHTGTIVSIDPGANHGMGKVTVRLDDGRVVTHSVVAPGIDPVG